MGSTPVNYSVLIVNSVLNVKAVVAAFNQEKALVGAFSVFTNLRWNFLKHYWEHFIFPTPETLTSHHTCKQRLAARCLLREKAD